jgi:hypothetical protein
VIGNADGNRAVGFKAHPFVALGVLEIGWDVHGGAPGEMGKGFNHNAHNEHYEKQEA